ncbi:alanine racemase [Streptomonospora nanhaiensis]|uniref:Alanine racemase n=1 Tax=Streptomonospora nanhaiensis TaxID=1323731 RepID=A0A853BQ55_9ACTN|nr:alanine racemase [Streptomonospora nanhaiensis]MBV2367063.1 alanine racemase [Streptomonospora nanhaiensis]MBX9387224.1 alanine racemase [Streptomonospora nanhaiensis]NYI97568.1 alanine racemase [Streptomonospora nanhaiensis]
MPSSFAEARVDLGAISENTATLARRAAGAQVMGVVKADGYGHGILPAARAMLAGGATWLGTAIIEEALELRGAGITAPLVSWIVPPGAPLAAALAADIDLGLSDPPLIAAVAAAARETGRRARVHLKADTGLNRGGVTADQWPAAVAAAARAEADGLIRVVGVFSHFACADEPGHPSIAAQTAAFHEALEVAAKAGLRPEVRHIANSAATLTLPETHFDLVRPGIASYGISPIPGLTGTGLRPAMTLRARIALVKRVPAGSGVSYGHRYTTDRATNLALVPLGYGDGIPRAATNTGPVWVAGRRRTVAGTVCMDQFMVDIGDDTAEEHPDAVLFGPGDGGEPTAQDWADALGTIPYEIVTRISPRVPRVYVGG